MVSNIRIVHLLGFLFIALTLISSWSFLPLKTDYWKNYATILGVDLIFIYFLYTQNFALKFHFTWQKLPLILLFTIGILSLFWTNFIDFTIYKIILWQVALFAFIIIGSIKWDSTNIHKLGIYLVISAVVVSIIGILQYLFNIPSDNLLRQVAFPASTFGNKNYAMHFLVLVVPMSLYLFFIAIKTYQKYLFALFISIILIYVFYTQTRGAWLGVLLEFILLSIFILFNKQTLSFDKYKIIAGVISFIIFLVFIHLGSNGFVNAFDMISSNVDKTIGNVANSDYERWTIYNNALAMIKDAPFFGTGLGSYYFNSINITNLYRSRLAHNDVLELGVELGVLGLLLFVGFVISLIYLWIKSLKSDNALITTVIIIALSGSLLNAMFSMPYQNAIPLLVAGIYLGFFYSITSNYQKAINLGFAKPITIGLGLLAFVSLFITSNSLKIENDINHHKANTSLFYHPNYYHLTTTLSDQYLQNDKYSKQAQKLIEWNLEKFPNNEVVLKQKLTLLLKQKDFLGAETYAQQLYFSEKQGYFGLVGLIDIYLQVGKKDLALKYYNELKNLSKEQLESYPIYYQVLYESANYLDLKDDMVEFLHRYIENNPTYNGLKYVKLLDEIYLASKVGDIRRFKNNYQILKQMPHNELIKDRAYYDMLDRAATGLLKYSRDDEKEIYKKDIKRYEKYLDIN
jgi:O-antigen ligase